MKDDVLPFFLMFVAFGIVMIIIGSVKSCTVMDHTMKKDLNSKCFEQTQDKNCWGIK